MRDAVRCTLERPNILIKVFREQKMMVVLSNIPPRSWSLDSVALCFSTTSDLLDSDIELQLGRRRLILYRAPISCTNDVLILLFVTLQIRLEERDHGFLSSAVEKRTMLFASQLVEHRDDSGWRWRVDDGRGDDGKRVFWVETGIMLVVAIEHADTSGMHVTANVRNAEVLLERQLLNALDEPVALVFVRSRTPVVAQIVEQLDLAVKVVGEAGRKTLGEHDERVHRDRERAFQKHHSRIGEWHTEQKD